MTVRTGSGIDELIVVYAPTGRDAALTCEVLARSDLHCITALEFDSLTRQIESGVGVVLIGEEALTGARKESLLAVLRLQPTWSDLPFIVFARHGDHTGTILETLRPLGNVTILERPVRITTLVSAVQTALRARRRQYEVRDLLGRLEENSRGKDEFLAMLGHELRNPLGAIRNAIAVMEGVDPLSERAARQRSVIHRQTGHLSRLVDDLLDVSRVTMGKITLQWDLVDLREVLERSAQSLRGSAEEQGHRLTTAIPHLPVMVHGDPVRLEQIVSNLLNNAIKYTPLGGRIRLTLERESDEAVIRVLDNGVGIAREQLTSVFDLFTQAQTSLDRAKGGLGLGLTLVRNLVEMHHGKVEARSDGPDRGSEFVVRLPALHVPDTLTESPVQAERPRATARRRVVVVEDNADGRETLQDLLELWGYEVEVAQDGPEGLRRVLESRPDLALIDIGLPGMDGYELAHEIQSRCDGTAPAMIAMTGYGQSADRDRAIACGFATHLIKPVSPEELARALAAPHQP